MTILIILAAICAFGLFIYLGVMLFDRGENNG
jgi:hypothetical protein